MSEKKHKLLVFHTPSHDNMFNKYFKTSFDKYLKDEFELVVARGEQICESATFKNSKWSESVAEKVKFVYEFIKNDKSDFFVFSDVDVEFFSPIKKHLVEELGDMDIAFQNDSKNVLCSGFFICKNNRRIRFFFETMMYNYDLDRGDQDHYNFFLKKTNVKYKFLSNRFFSIWRTNDRVSWDKKQNIIFPEYKINMLHANWAIGVEDKEKLLEEFQLRYKYQNEIKNKLSEKQLSIIEQLRMMSFSEYLFLCDNILSRKKCNLLIFGTGYDSKLWIDINKDGKTLFLEDSDEWIDKANEENPEIDIFKIKYDIFVKDNVRYVEEYKKSNNDFLKIDLPAEINNIKWDIILVDAPRAIEGNECGRSQSLYISYNFFLKNKNTMVFIHDCNRIAERIWTQLLFGNEFSKIDTLRKYERFEMMEL